MGDITTIDRADGLAALVSMAKNPHRWTIKLGRQLAGDRPIESIMAAIARLRAGLAPAPADRATRDRLNSALDERLRRLAVKVAMTASERQAEEWRSIMVDALSDLPAMVALTAAKRALHRPFRFANEIEGVVREIAEDVRLEHEMAINRLERLRLDIERAVSGAPAIADETAEPITAEEIRRMPAYTRTFGVTAGLLSQADIDAALAEGAPA